MKRFVLVSLLLSFCVGCGAYDNPVFVEIGNSQEAFMIQKEGDNNQASTQSEEYLAKAMVQAKRVELTWRWVKLGRGWNNGKFLPNEQVIIVDRKPITREWTAEAGSGTSTKNEALWVESADSVGFSTGISITARIAEKADAVKFLYNYPASEVVKIDTKNSYKDPYEVKTVSLEDVMDKEVRSRILSVFAREAAKEPMDKLRGKKNEIAKAIETEVIPFFKDRGITITNVGIFGGFHYENPKIQDSIDKVFQEQQDKATALAEQDAAKIRKEALKEKGEGVAGEKLAAAKGEAESIKQVADAKAYELQKLNDNPQAYIMLKQLELQKALIEKWDGKYPTYMMGDLKTLGVNAMMQLPDVPKTPVKAEK